MAEKVMGNGYSQTLLEIKSVAEFSYKAGYKQAINDLRSEIIQNMHVEISAKMLDEVLNEMICDNDVQNKNTSEIFCERLKRLLKSAGLSQKELAEKIGCTEVTVSRYIAGERVPKATIVVKIANALGVSVDYLIGNESRNTE